MRKKLAHAISENFDYLNMLAERFAWGVCFYGFALVIWVTYAGMTGKLH